MESKQNGASEFTVRPGWPMCSERELKNLMFTEYFKILLVSK